jgi:hypothetical protein
VAKSTKNNALQEWMPGVSKSLFQVRYRPELRFFDLLMSAAEKLDGYPDWETTRLSVVLKNYQQRRSVTINHTSITYEQDSADLEMEKREMGRILTAPLGQLKIETLMRLGFRRHCLLPVAMSFEDLVRIMNLKLLSQNENFLRILPRWLDDMLYRIDSTEGDHKFHVTVGPVRKSEIPQFSPIGANHLDPTKSEEERFAIISKYPDVAIFLDIDMYREGTSLPYSLANSFMLAARERVERLANDVCAFILSTVIS